MTNWIPYKMQPPPVGEQVLITFEYEGVRTVQTGTMYGDKKTYGVDYEMLTIDAQRNRKAIAWQPTPPPYQGE